MANSTCKYCGVEGLEWNSPTEHGGWELRDEHGVKHKCNYERRRKFQMMEIEFKKGQKEAVRKFKDEQGVFMTSKAEPHSVCWAVGQRIKQAREAKGWLQADLADRAGYDTTAISLWERGKRSIGIVKLADVAQALDVSVSYLTMDI